MCEGETFTRPGWMPGSFRVAIADDRKPEMLVKGWTALSFGIHEVDGDLEGIGNVTLAFASHLPSGLRLITTEELADAALAAEIAEPFMPEDDIEDITPADWRQLGEKLHAAWREADFCRAGIAEIAIWHRPPSTRLLDAILRHEIKSSDRWGGDIPKTIARKIAESYQALTAGLSDRALVRRLETEWRHWIFAEASDLVMQKEMAAAGITQEMAAVKGRELVKQCGGDRDKAARRLASWFRRKSKAAGEPT